MLQSMRKMKRAVALTLAAMAVALSFGVGRAAADDNWPWLPYKKAPTEYWTFGRSDYGLMWTFGRSLEPLWVFGRAPVALVTFQRRGPEAIATFGRRGPQAIAIFQRKVAGGN